MKFYRFILRVNLEKSFFFLSLMLCWCFMFRKILIFIPEYEINKKFPTFLSVVSEKFVVFFLFALHFRKYYLNLLFRSCITRIIQNASLNKGPGSKPDGVGCFNKIWVVLLRGTLKSVRKTSYQRDSLVSFENGQHST